MGDIEKKAKAAARAIIDDLTNRKGFRQTWDELDEDIQQEIREAWWRMIWEAFAAEKKDDNDDFLRWGGMP